MSRSLSYLRRGLLSIAFVGSLGFGVTQAFATPDYGRRIFCPMAAGPYPYVQCQLGCPDGKGYCAEDGNCICGEMPPLS